MRVVAIPPSLDGCQQSEARRRCCGANESLDWLSVAEQDGGAACRRAGRELSGAAAVPFTLVWRQWVTGYYAAVLTPASTTPLLSHWLQPHAHTRLLLARLTLMGSECHAPPRPNPVVKLPLPAHTHTACRNTSVAYSSVRHPVAGVTVVLETGVFADRRLLIARALEVDVLHLRASSGEQQQQQWEQQRAAATVSATRTGASTPELRQGTSHGTAARQPPARSPGSQARDPRLQAGCAGAAAAAAQQRRDRKSVV